MSEATYFQDGKALDYTPAVALVSGQVIQVPDGRAAVAVSAIAAGVLGAVRVSGVHYFTKTAGIVLLDGQQAYWDHSANSATFQTSNDRDFPLGTVIGDAESADTTVKVAINRRPSYLIDLEQGAFRSVAVGSAINQKAGSSQRLSVIATSEAEKADILSGGGFSKDANWIVDGVVCLAANGSGSTVDFNIGVANETHASNADTIAESVFLHIDGGSLVINAESDDGTTEVAAATTGISAVVGTPFHFMMDGRDPEDIQIYVNGVLVLPSTVFTLAAAVGPLKLLAHLEKSTGTETGDFYIDALRVRIME